MRGSLARSTRDRCNQHQVNHIIVTQPDSHAAVESVEASDACSVISLRENLGFAAANNFAAAETSGEYLAFLNPDLELTEGWLNPLIDALNDPAVAVAAPVLLNNDGFIEEAGQVVFSDGGTLAMGGSHWPGGRESYCEVMFDRDVDYASAACWVMRRLVFEELGGFSTDYYPAYFEDSDFAQRVQQAGFVTRLVTVRPVVHHHEGASADRLAMATNSRRTFEAKWAAVLTSKPERSLLDNDRRSVRDWHCENRNIAEVTPDSISSLADRASTDPRNRYTAVVSGVSSGELHSIRKRYASAGLEVVSEEHLHVPR
jgi:GT2 family glycosyltransferase